MNFNTKDNNIVCLHCSSSSSCLKVIDFSLSSFFNVPTDPGGTPDFVAPELLNNPEKFAAEGIGPEVDMWALGVVTHYLLSGQVKCIGINFGQMLCIKQCTIACKLDGCEMLQGEYASHVVQHQSG